MNGRETRWPAPRPRRPGPGAPRARGKASFGQTWWGAAWVEALEGRARLDPNRLPRGRAYARTGAVGALDARPGEITAAVQGSRRTPYQVRVRVRTFSPEEWETVLDALCSEIGHTAALLDGEIAPGVADDARAVGLDLLPGPGELQPRCTCPDWADPCKHAAAVCYLFADVLDEDPFALFTLRGRGRDEVLAGLRARRSAGIGSSPGGPAGADGLPSADPGVVARDAWARTVADLPVPPLPPRTPGRPTVLGVDPPRESGVDTARLRELALDAAARALDLALGGESTGVELSLDEDLARRAALTLDDPVAGGGAGRIDLATLASAAGLPARELRRRALAWQTAGREGLAVLSHPWDPPPGALEGARRLLGKGAAARRNRVTLGERQLRLGRDGRLHPYRRGAGREWEPDGPPFVEDAAPDA